MNGWEGGKKSGLLKSSLRGESSSGQNLGLLFSEAYLGKVLTTGLVWFSTAFSFYGLDYLFVLTLRRLNIQEEDGDTLSKILYSSLMQILIPVLAATVGHYYHQIKRCILGVQLLCSTLFNSSLFGPLHLLPVLPLLHPLEFHLQVPNFAPLHLPLPLHCHHVSHQNQVQIHFFTFYRASGFSICNSFGSFGSISMTWLGIYISKIGTLYPYLMFGAL